MFLKEIFGRIKNHLVVLLMDLRQFTRLKRQDFSELLCNIYFKKLVNIYDSLSESSLKNSPK